MTTHKQFDNRAAWLEGRRHSVGGSDAAAIAGLSPMVSRYAVYLEKRGLVPPKDDTEEMEMGRYMEPVIAHKLINANGGDGHYLSDVFRVTYNEQYPWMHATVDCLVREGIGECKNLTFVSDHDLSDAESPLRKMLDAQLHHNMAVADVKEAYLGAIISGSRFRHYRLDRGPKTEEAIEVAKAFWEDVRRGVEPPVDGSEATTSALRRRYPKDNGKPHVVTDPEAVIAFEEWDSADRALKEASKRAHLTRNRMLKIIGDSRFVVLPNGVKLSYANNSDGPRVLRVIKGT